MNGLASHPLHGIELFSGVGMLGEGLRAGLDHLGIPYRAVCHVEREAHAASVMVARMEEGSMDAAPIWSDVTTFDARKWRGKVDCVVAGFPCQDLSVAGRRAGLDGERSGLFFEVVRIADDCDAWLLVLENVGGIASATASVMDEEEGELEERAASRVLGELADRGWNAEWLHLSASDVGASHGRERWFCVAWRHMADSARHVGDGARDWQGGCRRGVCETGNELDDSFRDRRGAWRFADGRDDRNVADAAGALGVGDTSRDGWREGRPELSRRTGRSDSGGAGMPVADTSSPGRQGDELRGACARDGGGRKHMDQLANFVAYSPLAQPIRDGLQSSNTTQSSRRHLNPLFGAWLMGWPSTWVIAEPHASSASATASWRSALRSHLSYFFNEQELQREAA